MKRPSINRDDLAKYLEQVLDITRFRDYCPNGLQVEGKTTIRKIVSGVTASQALIDAAIDAQADAVLVHHGYFWRDENPCIVSMKHRRLKALLHHDINLFAYHLPLDHHPLLGNNAQLAATLNLQPYGHFGENDLGWLGKPRDTTVNTVGALAETITRTLHRPPLLVGDPNQPLEMVGWCSGAAQSLLPTAAESGAQVYLSGEISEPTAHQASELGIAYLACGHHATERLGIRALGDHLANEYNIEHEFIDIPNPA